MDSSKVRQESFIAAFMLGMKQYFGNVEHLRATLSEVPVDNADYRKQYLVIYDSVPGGTGYLKQLMLEEHSLIDIFTKALDVLEKCECKNDEQKDGCYHCLYAYRQSQNIGQISRSTAIRLLKQILSGKENLAEIPKLGDVPANALFESELERRFIEALSLMGNENRTVTISKELVNNKEGYLLQTNMTVWEIEPQVKLDASFGVAVGTRADFVLWPTRTDGQHKPVAIFTDGFLYHKNKVADDTLKREAIRRSGRFRVWTLSWKDVQNVYHAQGEYATDTLLPEKMVNGSRMYKPTVESEHASELRPYKASAMELLMNYLEEPDAERLFDVHARAYALSMLDMASLRNSASFTEWNMDVERLNAAFDLHNISFGYGNAITGIYKPRTSNSHLTIYAGVVMDDMQRNKAKAELHVYALLDDDEDERTDKYEAEWNGFWQFKNMMQFLGRFTFASTTGLAQMVYGILPTLDESPQAQTFDDTAAAWQETLEQIIDDETLSFAKRCIALGLPEPSAVGYELVGAGDDIIGEAELAWESRKIALLTQEQLDSEVAFVCEGWKIISSDEAQDIQSIFREAP